MSELYEKNYDSDLNDASYIPFMIRFISGVDNIPHSGILGCVEYYWDLTVKNLNDKVFTQLQNNYYDFTDSLNNENKEKRAEAYSKAKKITDNIIFHNVRCDMQIAKQRVLTRWPWAL